MFKETSGFDMSHIATENEKRDLCFYFEVVRFSSHSTGISDNTFVWGTELFRNTVKSKVCLLILPDKREWHVLAIGTVSSWQISPLNIAYLYICGTRHLDLCLENIGNGLFPLSTLGKLKIRSTQQKNRRNMKAVTSSQHMYIL